MSPIPVLTPEQSAAWDARAETAGVPLGTLMETAGRAALQVLAARLPERLAGGVLVAAGPGNNGGDGWVLARALNRLEVPVFVAPVGPPGSQLNRQMSDLARAEGVRVVDPEGPWPQVALAVDALLGTGARGPLRPPIRALVERLNDLALPLVAIDGPSGVDLGTGLSHGPAVQATLSITFGGLRRGHLLARDECGAVVVVDIGHPLPEAAWPVLVREIEVARQQARLAARAHKGTRGRVVVVGGDAGMTGALRIACRSAFAAGAGLVHAVAPPEVVELIRAAEPDVQTLAQEFSSPPTASLQELVKQCDALVLGPGLGRGEGRRELLAALAALAPAVVLDADGLNVFQGATEALLAVARGRTLMLTPHVGEFRRLFPEQGQVVESDPWLAAGAASRAIGATVLLKGVPTVIAIPDGQLLTIAAGNPGLATGGSGDLLSGLLGAMLASEATAAQAGAMAAQAMGDAADLAARRVSARAMRPMDVIAALPDVWRAWEVQRQVPSAPRPPVLYQLESPQRW
jgi:NAD(P)H-hydrate epimerase